MKLIYLENGREVDMVGLPPGEARGFRISLDYPTDETFRYRWEVTGHGVAWEYRESKDGEFGAINTLHVTEDDDYIAYIRGVAICPHGFEKATRYIRIDWKKNYGEEDV